MKRFVSIFWLTMFLVAGICTAQTTVITPNQVTVAWNEVTTGINGTPITGVIYEVYIMGSTLDRNIESNWVLIDDNITELQKTITFQTEGLFIVGTRAKRIIEGQNIFSEMNWSDVNGEETPNPFIILYAEKPNKTSNQRLLQ